MPPMLLYFWTRITSPAQKSWSRYMFAVLHEMADGLHAAFLAPLGDQPYIVRPQVSARASRYWKRAAACSSPDSRNL